MVLYLTKLIGNTINQLNSRRLLHTHDDAVSDVITEDVLYAGGDSQLISLPGEQVRECQPGVVG